jgi:hypothetical protein
MQVHFKIIAQEEGSDTTEILMDHTEELPRADAENVVDTIWRMVPGGNVEGGNDAGNE